MENAILPELIVMLTHRDRTVPNAVDAFRSAEELAQNWGFKDVGLDASDMRRLATELKLRGKTTYLEVVSLTEEDGLRGAQLAADCGIDVLMGTVYGKRVMQSVARERMRYFPFVGKVHGHPSVLEGEVGEIIEHAKTLEGEGVDGLDLLTYRFAGDAPGLLRGVTGAVEVPVVSAGSIDSFARMAEVLDAGAWGFTIGSALFEGTFVAGGSFEDNLRAVAGWLRSMKTEGVDGRR